MHSVGTASYHVARDMTASVACLAALPLRHVYFGARDASTTLSPSRLGTHALQFSTSAQWRPLWLHDTGHEHDARASTETNGGDGWDFGSRPIWHDGSVGFRAVAHVLDDVWEQVQKKEREQSYQAGHDDRATEVICVRPLSVGTYDRVIFVGGWEVAVKRGHASEKDEMMHQEPSKDLEEEQTGRASEGSGKDVHQGTPHVSLHAFVDGLWLRTTETGQLCLTNAKKVRVWEQLVGQRDVSQEHEDEMTDGSHAPGEGENVEDEDTVPLDVYDVIFYECLLPDDFDINTQDAVLDKHVIVGHAATYYNSKGHICLDYQGACRRIIGATDSIDGNICGNETIPCVQPVDEGKRSVVHYCRAHKQLPNCVRFARGKKTTFCVESAVRSWGPDASRLVTQLRWDEERGGCMAEYKRLTGTAITAWLDFDGHQVVEVVGDMVMCGYYSEDRIDIRVWPAADDVHRRAERDCTILLPKGRRICERQFAVKLLVLAEDCWCIALATASMTRDQSHVDVSISLYLTGEGDKEFGKSEPVVSVKCEPEAFVGAMSISEHLDAICFIVSPVLCESTRKRRRVCSARCTDRGRPRPASDGQSEPEQSGEQEGANDDGGGDGENEDNGDGVSRRLDVIVSIVAGSTTYSYRFLGTARQSKGSKSLVKSFTRMFRPRQRIYDRGALIGCTRRGAGCLEGRDPLRTVSLGQIDGHSIGYDAAHEALFIAGVSCRGSLVWGAETHDNKCSLDMRNWHRVVAESRVPLVALMTTDGFGYIVFDHESAISVVQSMMVASYGAWPCKGTCDCHVQSLYSLSEPASRYTEAMHVLQSCARVRRLCHSVVFLCRLMVHQYEVGIEASRFFSFCIRLLMCCLMDDMSTNEGSRAVIAFALGAGAASSVQNTQHFFQLAVDFRSRLHQYHVGDTGFDGDRLSAQGGTGGGVPASEASLQQDHVAGWSRAHDSHGGPTWLPPGKAWLAPSHASEDVAATRATEDYVKAVCMALKCEHSRSSRGIQALVSLLYPVTVPKKGRVKRESVPSVSEEHATGMARYLQWLAVRACVAVVFVVVCFLKRC